MSGQLAAFARLGALRDFDLQFVGVDQVIASVTPNRAEATCLIALRCESPFGSRHEARFVFPALAGVGLAADAVHGDRQRLVRFCADRTERHRAGGEALHDFARRLDFFERNRTRGSS